MRRVRVWAQLSDEAYHAYEGEARRRGVEVERLVEQTLRREISPPAKNLTASLASGHTRAT
jgi:hypothetical protein